MALSQAFRGRGTARALLQARRGSRCSGGPGGASEVSHESDRRQQPALRPPDSSRPSEAVAGGSTAPPAPILGSPAVSPPRPPRGRVEHKTRVPLFRGRESGPPPPSGHGQQGPFVPGDGHPLALGRGTGRPGPRQAAWEWSPGPRALAVSGSHAGS